MKFISLIFLLAFNAICFGQSFPTNYISPSNIQWNNSPLPRDIDSNKDLKKWYERVGQEQISRWSYISLLSNRNEQIILQGSSTSSGGLNFLLLTKQDGLWRPLIDINGGFIFYPVPNSSPTLVIYQKSGLEYFRSEYQFRQNKFKQVSAYEVPLELTRLNNSPVDFNKFFWFISIGSDK